jgi:hypothetical protein
MPRVSIALTVLAVGLLSIAVPRMARAEPPNPKAMPIYVLSILTDDADDQADALTQALRARVRQASGLSLLETQQSLETLTIALRCPVKPDGPCLQRIGDQLHADHYVWGSLAKRKGGEVVADMHFWSRGKPQTDAGATFSDNLKDPSDEALRSVAAKLLGELTNASSSSGADTGETESATGTLIVHAGSGGGTVLVDGAEKGTLEAGTAKVDVPQGSHKVTVHVPGFQAPSLTTTVKAGTEQEVSFALAPGEDDTGEGEAGGPSKPFPTRKVIGWSAVGVGAILAVVAVVELAGWVSDKNDSDTQRMGIPANVSDACSVGPGVPYAAQAALACSDSNDAKTKSTIAWITGAAGLAAGGVGVFLLATDHDASGDTASPSATARATPRLHVAPMMGPHEGGLRLQLRF